MFCGWNEFGVGVKAISALLQTIRANTADLRHTGRQRCSRLYRGVMIRFLITFLALMSGLAAQGLPAEARICGENQVVVGAMVQARQGHAAQVEAVVAAQVTARPVAQLGEGPGLPLVRPVMAMPALYAGIDRARE